MNVRYLFKPTSSSGSNNRLAAGVLTSRLQQAAVLKRARALLCLFLPCSWSHEPRTTSKP
jgi:hypothetical protein